MIMNNYYKNKYNKYINKNICLLQNQTGGTLVDVGNGTNIDHLTLTILHFNKSDNKVVATRHAVKDGELKTDLKYPITVNTSPDDYSILIEHVEPSIRTKPVCIITKTTKTFYLYCEETTVIIKNNLTNFDAVGYYKTTNAEITIINGQLIMQGICEIAKSTEIEINIKIESICDYQLQIDITLKNIFEMLNTHIEYNYEDAYDEFKMLNLDKYCKDSSVLLKNFYNSNFNIFALKNTELFKMLKTNYGLLLKLILNINMNLIKDPIKNICENSEDRHTLLQNIMKRIETINPNIMIQNSTGTYVDFPSQFKVIFDTGNSSTTLVGINIVNALGLRKIESFKYSGSGVGGKSEYVNGYVNMKLKLNENAQYYLPAEYDFVAIIDSKNLKDTLLIGHTSKIFDDFFKNNYCIGYNYIKSDENALKMSETEITKSEILYKLKVANDKFKKIQNVQSKNNINLYLDTLCDVLFQVEMNKVYLVNFQIDEIYRNTLTELTNFATINEIIKLNTIDEEINEKVTVIENLKKKLII